MCSAKINCIVPTNITIRVHAHIHFLHAVPDQVSGVKFVSSVDENSLSVGWNRPESDASILYYEIWYRLRTGRRTWQRPLTTTTENVTLHGSRVHSLGVQVRAVSAIGEGQFSREVVLKGL